MTRDIDHIGRMIIRRNSDTFQMLSLQFYVLRTSSLQGTEGSQTCFLRIPRLWTSVTCFVSDMAHGCSLVMKYLTVENNVSSASS